MHNVDLGTKKSAIDGALRDGVDVEQYNLEDPVNARDLQRVESAAFRVATGIFFKDTSYRYSEAIIEICKRLITSTSTTTMNVIHYTTHSQSISASTESNWTSKHGSLDSHLSRPCAGPAPCIDRSKSFFSRVYNAGTAFLLVK